MSCELRASLKLCEVDVLHSEGFWVSLPEEPRSSGGMRWSVYISCHILAPHQLLWGHFFWTGFLGFHFVGDACLKVLERGVSVAGGESDFQLTGIFLVWQLNPPSYVSLIPVQAFKESSTYEAAEGCFLACT